jgi:diaminopimelate epimerase
MLRLGREFYKLTGSGNDFVFFDARHEPSGSLETPERIAALCAHGTGIGADGVVFLTLDDEADFRMRYYNSDGSLASLCGNASLCSTRLAVELGIASPDDVRFQTDAGLISARMRDGLPEIDLQLVEQTSADAGIPIATDELAMGFAVAGVPHLVVSCPSVERIDVHGRGSDLRYHPSLAHGANVNFVSPSSTGDGWDIRTYERGVEGETLACGTGAVASAVLLRVWNEASGPVRLRTRSGRPLEVRLTGAAGAWRPSLRGEGRIVFHGTLGEL